MKYIIYISMLAMLFSCKARKQVETKETISSSDSIVYIERTTIDTVRIPSEGFSQSYPKSFFSRDTVIICRSGRASSRIESNKGVLNVTTKCDSLEKLVLSTQTELKELSKQSHTKEVIEKTTKHVPWWYKASLWLVLIAIVLLIIKKVFNTYFKVI